MTVMCSPFTCNPIGASVHKLFAVQLFCVFVLFMCMFVYMLVSYVCVFVYMLVCYVYVYVYLSTYQTVCTFPFISSSTG